MFTRLAFYSPRGLSLIKPYRDLPLNHPRFFRRRSIRKSRALV